MNIHQSAELPRPASVEPLVPPWRELRRFEVLDSTQTHARRLVETGESPRGVVICADRQTAGRGRFDRTWLSPPGGLYATAVLPLPPPDLALRGWLSLAAALAAVEALEKLTGVRPDIKWPNDLVIDGRKLAGILGEVVGEVVLIGLGLNWRNDARDVAHPGDARAVSLAEAIPGLTLEGRDDFLRLWLERLAGWQESLAREPAAATGRLRERLEPILWRRGRAIRLAHAAQGDVKGVLLGLDDRGRARIRRSDGKELAIASR